MAHRARFMKEVAPGKWLIKCRICRGTLTSFTTPADCHAWWREHIVSDRHRESDSPEGREQRLCSRRQEQAMNAAGKDLIARMVALQEHAKTCAVCVKREAINRAYIEEHGIFGWRPAQTTV